MCEILKSSSIYSIIHFGDCLEKMQLINDGAVDMILCDLPYGKTKNKIDTPLPLDKLWNEYERIIKPNGCIALFAQGSFYVDVVNVGRKIFRYDLIWDKVLTTGFLNAKDMPLRQHEQIAIFYKKKPTYNPRYTIGEPLHGRGKKCGEVQTVNNNYGSYNSCANKSALRQGDIRKHPTSIIRQQKPHPSTAVHPTQKSVECCKWLINTYTNPGDVVLDNCMGSGTTGVACIELDRKFVGIEISYDYFNIAEGRIKEAARCVKK